MKACIVVTVIGDNGEFEVWEYDFDSEKQPDIQARLDTVMHEAERACDDFIKLH